MKAILFVALAVVGLASCTVNSSRPTSWGKEGVSMVDYQTDGILCAALAENAGTDNGAKTAGGINGSNAGAQSGGGAGAAVAGGAGGSEGGATPMGGGTYQETASPDLVSRAANQQRAREMKLKQARIDSLRSCLVGRGYTEFALTAEQRAHLATLPQGSDQRREYLYKLGTDPAVLHSSAVANSPDLKK